MKSITNCTRLLAVLVGIAALAIMAFVSTPAFAAATVATDQPGYWSGNIVSIIGSS